MDLVVRFLLGGAIVSVFSVLGEMFKPKTFSGLFGAAPSVAIASLGLAFHKHGGAYVQTEARSMIVGGIALLIYAAVCVALVKREHLPVWLGAMLAWVAWVAVAFALFGIARAEGLAR